jgi:hypothetical protein
MLTGSEIVDWAVSSWTTEVKDRPLQNDHRRALDTKWRQLIRHFGGDDVDLCGPSNDELVATDGPPSSRRQRRQSGPVGISVPRVGMHG